MASFLKNLEIYYWYKLKVAS